MGQWTRIGKQVMQDGRHFADAAGETEAMMIVNALKALDSASVINRMQHSVVRDAVRKPRMNLNTCRVHQQGDEMACACGLRWDVNDPDPPLCVHRAPTA